MIFYSKVTIQTVFDEKELVTGLVPIRKFVKPPQTYL